MAAARELASFSEDARWHDLGNGTLDVVTMQNGPVERYLVLEDGTTMLLGGLQSRALRGGRSGSGAGAAAWRGSSARPSSGRSSQTTGSWYPSS